MSIQYLLQVLLKMQLAHLNNRSHWIADFRYIC